jgi:hypothetical protein
MVARPSTPKLWAKRSALDLIKLFDPAPRLIANCPGNIDLQPYYRHRSSTFS